MKTYRSTLNVIMVPVLVMLVFGIIASFFIAENEIGEEIPIQIKIFLGLVAAMLLWILLDTNYKIKENQLLYCSGPIRGKININKINKIENVKTWYVTSILKPALGSYGLTITYNKFDDIYISPKNKSEFVAELLKINPNIQIIA
ncbi:PH domain-containing protein [Flavobacterium sp. SM15]|uniref:PH domain-containing protein n=1 Tax=Flavobacterium sp. SM15 TaxID=2908005 RepID=UPI001EDA5300|nr:PH domain-containing protein [Flavobacterium sp. SM15]MCG2612487.1 PH domain-containing protein [Flavobacterium sp. SM15]